MSVLGMFAIDAGQFRWAEELRPRRLTSQWWLGHIPFAFELVGRLRPATLVELGTYSGSSFAAFCQAVEACASGGRCYGIDLWQGDIHMGPIEDDVFEEVSAYIDKTYPGIGTLIRQDFTSAARLFENGSIDLLHIDGTHTYEAVSKDFHTWLPRMSDRGVILFHDVNVTLENAGPAAVQFGVREFFDGVKRLYPHFEFAHSWGLGVLIVGDAAPPAVMEMVRMARDPAFAAYFARKGAILSQRFAEIEAVSSRAGKGRQPATAWRRLLKRLGVSRSSYAGPR